MSYLSPIRFLRSLRHAGRGLQRAMSEHSFRVHVAVALVVIGLLLWLDLQPIETALVVLVVALVLILELVNTVVERFVGLLEPRVHPYVGVIKDLMAAGVLVASLAAVAIAGLILVPAFWR